jgi:hypothetical protein
MSGYKAQTPEKKVLVIRPAIMLELELSQGREFCKLQQAENGKHDLGSLCLASFSRLRVAHGLKVNTYCSPVSQLA